MATSFSVFWKHGSSERYRVSYWRIDQLGFRLSAVVVRPITVAVFTDNAEQVKSVKPVEKVTKLASVLFITAPSDNLLQVTTYK